MKTKPLDFLIYHITDVANLPSILREGGLRSDALMQGTEPMVIGYSHIKERRLTQIRVPCCGERYVGEFVPFYFCPRSPMLYTTNIGRTGRPPGCQRTILHLVSRVSVGIDSGRDWAVSDGNAGAFHTCYDSTLSAIKALDWAAIRATVWVGRTHEKMAEFLVAEFFPWTGFHAIGCHNPEVAEQTRSLVASQDHRPLITIQPTWYY